jgi:tetratricopeptide (TPR) repeat protein
VLDNDPDNIKAAVGLGHYYLKMGRAGEAERVFEQLKLRSRSNPLIVKQIALIYLDQKKYQEAAEALQILLEDNGDKPEIHYFLGMAFEGLKKTDEAIATYMKVKDGSSYYRSAVVHLSFLYQEKGDQQRAVNLMNEALKKEPNEPELYLFLGALYEEMEAYDKAVHTLKKGLDFQPDHIRLHFRLGVVYDKSGDKEACIHEMRTIVDTDPTHAEALNYLGYTYAELGTNLDEAEDLIKRAMEHKPNDGYITDSLGWVYYKKGLFKEAIKFLEEAAKLVSDDPTILEHLADTCIKMNDTKRALKYYKKALEYIEEDNDKGSIKGKIESLEKKLSQDT